MVEFGTALGSNQAGRLPGAADVLALSNERLEQTIEQKGVPTHRDASTMQLSVNSRGSALARNGRYESALFRAGDRAAAASRCSILEPPLRSNSLPPTSGLSMSSDS